MSDAMMMTEEQKRIMAQFIADYNGGDSDEYLDEDIYEFELTRDEFECYDGSTWASHRGQTYEDRSGHRAVCYDAAQAVKGQRRVRLWVIDFGDFRAIYQS
jgi:hypothetical protein